MHLFLLNNNPLHTTLLDQDGHALYSISSSSSPSPSSESPLASPHPALYPGYHEQPSDVHATTAIDQPHSTPAHSCPTPLSFNALDSLPSSKSSGSTPGCQPANPPTSIKRLRSYESSTSSAVINVGKVDSMGHDDCTRVQLCTLGIEICIPPTTRSREVASLPPSESQAALARTNDDSIAFQAFQDFCVQSQQQKPPAMPAPAAKLASNQSSIGGTDKTPVPEPTWAFKGPDERPYKWISLASNPVLVHDTQPPTPIACFRPAKLGIVSRSRRGFLEILPPGLDKEDWIVVTFVGYFRMRLGDRLQCHTPRPTHEEVQSLPIGNGMTATMSNCDGNIPLATKLKSMAPLQNPLSKPLQKASLPPAYVEAIRRMNRNPIPRRTY